MPSGMLCDFFVPPEIFDMISCDFNRVDFARLFEAQLAQFKQNSSYIFDRSAFGDMFKEAKTKELEGFIPKTLEIFRLDSVLRNEIKKPFDYRHLGILEKTTCYYESAFGWTDIQVMQTVFQSFGKIVTVKMDNYLEKAMPFYTWNAVAPRVVLTIRGFFEPSDNICERISENLKSDHHLDWEFPIGVSNWRQLHRECDGENPVLKSNSMAADMKVTKCIFRKKNELITVGGIPKSARRFEVELDEESAAMCYDDYVSAEQHFSLGFRTWTLVTDLKIHWLPEP